MKPVFLTGPLPHFILYRAVNRRRTRWNKDYKYTSLGSNMLTLKKKETAGNEHQTPASWCSTGCTALLFLFAVRPADQKPTAVLLLPKEKTGEGNSLQVLRRIQGLIHPLSSPSPNTCDESPLTAPTSLFVRQGQTPV